jgi:hypothetical protein
MGDVGREDVRETQRELHIALVVPDLKQFHALRTGVFAVVDAEFPNIKPHVHVLLANDGTTDADRQNIVARHALVTLGLVAPDVAQLQYPEEIEIGWNEPPPDRA